MRRNVNIVSGAIELPSRNGQTEGQINRLKTLKRAMYRAVVPFCVAWIGEVDATCRWARCGSSRVRPQTH
jgi:hypothetical protein